MVNSTRQLPADGASAWVIDLDTIEGPRFVVLRRDEAEAREALVAHVVDIGTIAYTIEAARIVNAARITSLAVGW